MINKTINGYKILRYINHGGMADVWYAENVLGKPAAIKILKKKYSDEAEVVTRFENEAKLTVNFKHDNIRNVYDYAVFEDMQCIIMEYLDGEDLSTKLTNGETFTNQQLTKWWSDLADTLNYTHNKGIIHRDIKPSNIFITTDGKLKLLDFGIAKVRESINLTLTGQGLGTVVYMSPEQIKDPKSVTYKTDVYSLAVTFFNLITGKQPYDRTSSSDFEIQTKIIQEPLNMELLPLPWRVFLANYLNKTPTDRKELEAIKPAAGIVGKPVDEFAAAAGDETFVKPGDETFVKADDKTTVIKTPEYEKEKVTVKSKPTAAIVFVVLIIAALCIFAAIKYFNNHKAQQAELATDTTAADKNKTDESKEAKVIPDNAGVAKKDDDTAPGLYPEASERLLVDDDLNAKSKPELKIMRNEIYARHGFIFKTPEMKKYFGAQSWYSPLYDDVTAQLSSIEKTNIDLIKTFEK